MNRAWHEQHKLPKRATAQERLAWHQEHQKHCGCRPVPASLRALLDARQAKTGSGQIYVALLRAVNVAGHNKVAMSDLRDLLGDLGFSGVKSLLQSGNLVFKSDRLTGAGLERLLEMETANRLEVSADFVVRSAADWGKLIASNPFPEEAKSDPGHLVVVFLKTAAAAKNVDALLTAIQGPETISSDGKQLYVVYPAGIGRSKLTIPLIEQRLGTRGTGRNWNTVLKLAALCQ